MLFNPLQTFEVPPDEQIVVEAGYFIGVFFPDNGAGGIYFEVNPSASAWTMSQVIHAGRYIYSIPSVTAIQTNDTGVYQNIDKLPSLVAFINEGIC
jgi:hypothetical protein